jgi:hypothetical protein
MSAARADSWATLRLAGAIWLALVVILAFVDRALFFQVPFLETADAAVNGVMIENARHFAQLYGNYSRFQFNHPGPVFYYVYAAGELLLRDLLGVAPSPANAHVFTCAVLQCAFFAWAVAVFAANYRRTSWLPLVLLASALWLGGNAAAFVDIWPPNVLLMPFLAFAASCVSLASGRLEHLVAVVVAGGFLFHGHVAQSMFVGVLAPAALAVNLLRQRGPPGALGQWCRAHRVPLIASAVTAVVFLLPPLIDLALYGSRSNLATIVGRFGANTEDSKTLLQSVVYFASFATPSTDQDQLAIATFVQQCAYLSTYAWRLSFWGLVFVGAPIVGWIGRRRFGDAEWRFLATGWCVLAATVALCLLWGMAQAGGMHHFNGVFYYGVYFLALMLAGAVAARGLQRWYRAEAGVAMIAVAAVLLAAGRIVVPPVGENSGLAIRDAVHVALTGQPDAAPRFLVYAQGSWPVAAAVALELHRNGPGFQVAPWWGFVFGAEHEREQPALRSDDAPAIWWIAPRGPDGIPLNDDLALFVDPAPIRPDGDEIVFREHGNAFRYVVAGVTYANTDAASTNLPDLTIRFAAVPAQRDVRIVFDADCWRPHEGHAAPQAADVTLNGASLGRVEVAGREQVEVRVPAADWNRSTVANLHLHFPGAVRQVSKARPRYEEWSAWRLWSVQFIPVR